jgi:hypothetical protein
MKDQYFGDVNDFRKYGLLRVLTGADKLRLGVCWMLTAPDGRADGKFLAYLGQREKYRPLDPELFDWLHKVVGSERDRRTARIEKSGFLGSALFQSRLLTDALSDRETYFAECAEKFAGSDLDLVFFDPDNGLEVRSTPRGHRRSSKYLYWKEVFSIFDSGSSVLIYQHFIREKRSAFTARMAEELRRRVNPAAVFSFRTPHVLFLLAAHERHVPTFREQLAVFGSHWSPSQIVAEERAAADEPLQQTRTAFRSFEVCSSASGPGC